MGRREQEGVSKAWPKGDVHVAATEVSVAVHRYFPMVFDEAEDGEERVSSSFGECGQPSGHPRGAPLLPIEDLTIPSSISSSFY